MCKPFSTGDEGSTNDDGHDQDSSPSFESDSEGDSHQETEEEDWIESIKRSAREAEEQMQKFNIGNWIKTQRRVKWRQATTIASQKEERWTRRAAEWEIGR